jgi:endonuclease I
MRRLLSLSLIFLVAAACEDDFVSPVNPDFDLSGLFTDTLAQGQSDTLTFTPGRTGTTTVAICAEEGFNFDLEAGGQTSATSANCERVTFQAVAGQSYTAIVRAVSGDGVYGGCWSTALVQCEPSQPVACAPPAFSADTTLPAGYYSATQGKTGTALIDALYRIVCRARVLGYTSARDSLYANVEDPDNDDLMADVYFGRVDTVNSRATADSANFNTEHAWPQSKGAADDPAMSDIHHLFPSDETANSQRSNLPFGVVVDTLWIGADSDGDGDVSVQGLDAERDPVFEPRDSKKGDIARALLYFYVRYKNDPTENFTLENFIDEEATLIDWAADDPPDAHERARNALIFRAQGNRNPFIDRPEFVAAIGDFPNN